RDAEAVDRYGDVRERLAEALGADPGQQLQAVYQAILRGELAPAALQDPAAPGPAGPAQLPPDLSGFSGRGPQLRQVDAIAAAVSPAPGAAAGAAAIAAIDGMAGVGKTTLAVHWTHRVAPRFPGGQLYVNLRGFDPGGAPVRPDEAVRGFLDA